MPRGIPNAAARPAQPVIPTLSNEPEQQDTTLDFLPPAQEIYAPGNVAATKAVAKTFKPRSTKPKIDEEDKIYEFELVTSTTAGKPVDKATGKQLEPPYPPRRGWPNEGIAFDEDYKDPETGKLSPRARAWRLIEGQPSIWVDEQDGLAGMDKDQINELLGQPENSIWFINGKLNVRGIEKLKLKALMVQDYFEGKKRQYRVRNRAYRLNNPDAIVVNQMSKIEAEYAAMKKAMDCTTEEMIECAYVMGIDIQDQSEQGINAIKLQFLQKAKYDEKNPKQLDWFIGIVSNPATHVTYVFGEGIAKGIISGTQQYGKLTWAHANTPIMDINSAGNIPDQLVAKYLDDDPKVFKLLAEIEKQLDIN